VEWVTEARAIGERGQAGEKFLEVWDVTGFDSKEQVLQEI